MEIGTCALCLEEHPLIKSHYLPAALYRLIRDQDIEGKLVVAEGSSSAYSTFEFRIPLLCATCEKRLSDGGEAYTLGNCYRGEGNFALQELLQTSGKLERMSDSVTMCPTVALTDVKTKQLVYFAASIFWRGSVCQWRDKTGHFVNRPELGRLYQEEFRRYLLGTGEFPDRAVMLVNVSSRPKPLTNMFTLPVGKRRGEHHIFLFAMPGLDFTLFLGQRIPKGCYLACAHHSEEKYVGFMDNDEHFLHAVLGKIERTTPKGKLQHYYESLTKGR
jgi:hypothetical protein